MFSGSKSFFRNPTGGGVATPSDASFSSVPLLLQTTSAVTGKSTTVSDAATPSYAFTASGSPTFGLTSPYQPDGYWSNYFGGTSDYLSLTGNAGFNFSTNDFTVECWAYFNDLSDYRTLIGNYTAPIATGNGQWLFQHIITTNKMGFYYDNGTVITGTTTLTTGIWYHFAMVRSGSTITAYVNGVSQGTATFSGTVGSSSATLNIGAPQNISTARMNGYISNVRIVKGTAVYTGAFTPSTTPLTAIANTSLLTCQSNRFIDNSTNKFTITPSGTPSISAETPVQPDGYWSNQFNGSTDYVGPANNAAFQFGSNNFTIEYWFNQISRLPSGYDATFILTGSMYFTMGNGSYGYALVVSGGSNLVLGSPVGSNLLPSLNTWHHMAIVRNGSTFTVYLNGVSLGTTTFAGALANPTGGFQVGWAGTFDSYFNGYISNFRAVKGTAVYTSNFTPPTAPLTAIANTVLLTCQSSSFKDNSTNNFTITRNGSPVTKSVVQPFTSSITSNGAALFNGSSSYLTTITTPITTTTSTFTVEAWIYSTVSGSSFPIIGDQNSAGSQVNWGFYVSSSNLLGLYWWNNSTNFATGNTTIKSNEWTHVALSISSNAISMYVNGVQQTISGATTFSNRVSTLSSLLIGQLSGYISNLRIVNGVTVYTGAFTPPSNFLTTTGGTYPSTSNVNTSIASTNTSLLANLNNGTYSGSSTLNTVTRNGTPTTGWISPYQTDGYWGNYLNGSSYLQFSASTAFAPGTGDFTVESWVYVITHNVAQGNWLYSQSASGHNYFVITFGPSGAGFTAASSGAGTGIGNSTTINTNTWYHIAVTRSSGIVRVFVNGVSGTPTSNTTDFTNVSYVPTIGSYSHAVYGLWNGYISNFRYVKGVAVYTGNFTPPTSPLQITQSSGINIAAITGTQTSLLTCQSNRFKDNSNNNFTVGLGGSPQINPYYYPSGFTAPTASLGAGYFSGNGDYLTIPNNPALRPGTSDFTLECWVYWSGTNSGNATNFNILGSTWSGYSQTGQWIFYIDPSTGVVRFQVWNSVGVASTTALAQNRWYHIAVTRSSNTFKLYLNGKLDATNTISLDASTTVWNFYIGAYYDPSGPTYYGYFPGYLSDLRLVLNTVVYTGDFTPPSGRLTQTGGTYPSTTNVNTSIPATNTRLLLNFAESNYTSASTGVNNNTFIDDSNYAYTVTRNGTPTQGSFTPYWPNGYWSNYFRTNGDYISVPDSANVELGANNFQMDAWVYLTAYPASNLGSYASSILAKGNFAGTRSYEFNISGASGTDLGVALTNAGGTTTNIVSAFSFALNTWYSVRASRVSNRVYLFVNGTLLNAGGTAYSDTVSNGTDALKVGRANLDVNYVFQLFGYVNNVSLAIGGTGYSTASYTPATTPTVATADTRFLSCQSNRFRDNSVNNALVTVSGTPSVQAFVPFSTGVAYSPVLHGGSGYFKGSPDYLNSPTNTNFALGTNNFTIEMWVYLITASGGKVAASFGNFATYDPLIGYLSAGSAAFEIRLSSTGSSWNISDGSVLSYPLNLNSWNHIALVRNGSNIALYGNGSLVGSVTSSASIYQNGNYAFVGKGQSAFYFPGYISNFRFTRAAVYTAAFTPPIAPVTAITNTSLLLNFTNAAIYDVSAQNDVTTVGDTQSSTTIFKWAPTSIKFDGTGDYLNLSTGSPQSLTFGTGNFTIEFWVYFTSNTGQQCLYDGRPAPGSYPLLYTNAGVITYYVGGAPAITSIQPSTGVWYFMSLRRSSGTTQFFINGVQSGGSYTDSTNYLAPPTSGARVGANYGGGDFLFGYIQDLRISKTARPVTPIPTAAFPTR